MDNFTYWKLFEINYNIQIHELSANERFCSQIDKILVQIFESNIFQTKESKKTKEYKLFMQMKKDIENTIKLLNWRIPLRLKNRKNATAIKYIKLLKHLELEWNSSHWK